MNERTRKPTKEPLPPELAARVCALIRIHGGQSVANAFGMSEPTLGKAGSGMEVEAGTRARIEVGLARFNNNQNEETAT